MELMLQEPVLVTVESEDLSKCGGQNCKFWCFEFRSLEHVCFFFKGYILSTTKNMQYLKELQTSDLPPV